MLQKIALETFGIPLYYLQPHHVSEEGPRLKLCEQKKEGRFQNKIFCFFLRLMKETSLVSFFQQATTMSRGKCDCLTTYIHSPGQVSYFLFYYSITVKKTSETFHRKSFEIFPVTLPKAWRWKLVYFHAYQTNHIVLFHQKPGESWLMHRNKSISRRVLDWVFLLLQHQFCCSVRWKRMKK